MYAAPPSRRILPMIGNGPSTPSSSEVGSPAQPRALRRRQHLAQQPWESMAVQSFASRVSAPQPQEESVSALVLKSPQGTVLRAVGAKEDHEVAGRIVADIQNSTGGHTSSQGSLAKVGSGVLAKHQVAFGAVYEHRDACGKPRLIGSTNVLPERQFQLDWQDHSQVRSLTSEGGQSGHLVWVGIGSGVVGEKEMSRVREAVVTARSERLRLEKLGSEKPYSRHF
mmetsp:Transcript_59729/g.142118  ORF Transcript_59729/g.142118 Transcript_59729/m.142118 type:complete len:225 (-) Transcript_59729:81-755(-)